MDRSDATRSSPDEILNVGVTVPVIATSFGDRLGPVLADALRQVNVACFLPFRSVEIQDQMKVNPFPISAVLKFDDSAHQMAEDGIASKVLDEVIQIVHRIVNVDAVREFLLIIQVDSRNDQNRIVVE